MIQYDAYFYENFKAEIQKSKNDLMTKIDLRLKNLTSKNWIYTCYMAWNKQKLAAVNLLSIKKSRIFAYLVEHIKPKKKAKLWALYGLVQIILKTRYFLITLYKLHIEYSDHLSLLTRAKNCEDCWSVFPKHFVFSKSTS